MTMEPMEAILWEALRHLDHPCNCGGESNNCQCCAGTGYGLHECGEVLIAFIERHQKRFKDHKCHVPNF